MQIFVPFKSPLSVAMLMYRDRHRFNRQITECKIIIDAIEGRNKWKHPIIDMYRDHVEWVKAYQKVFIAYRDYERANCSSEVIGPIQEAESRANQITPGFLTDDFCTHHKKRLYTKAPNMYPAFSKYGESHVNWYWVDNKLLVYQAKE